MRQQRMNAVDTGFSMPGTQFGSSFPSLPQLPMNYKSSLPTAPMPTAKMSIVHAAVAHRRRPRDRYSVALPLHQAATMPNHVLPNQYSQQPRIRLPSLLDEAVASLPPPPLLQAASSCQTPFLLQQRSLPHYHSSSYHNPFPLRPRHHRSRLSPPLTGNSDHSLLTVSLREIDDMSTSQATLDNSTATFYNSSKNVFDVDKKHVQFNLDMNTVRLRPVETTADLQSAWYTSVDYAMFEHDRKWNIVQQKKRSRRRNANHEASKEQQLNDMESVIKSVDADEDMEQDDDDVLAGEESSLSGSEDDDSQASSSSNSQDAGQVYCVRGLESQLTLKMAYERKYQTNRFISVILKQQFVFKATAAASGTSGTAGVVTPTYNDIEEKLAQLACTFSRKSVAAAYRRGLLYAKRAVDDIGRSSRRANRRRRPTGYVPSCAGPVDRQMIVIDDEE
jgi:hypothetical protein